MTTETTAHGAPHFPTRSRASQLVQDVLVVALCAAITGGFLAHAWRAPEPAASPAPAAAELASRS